MVAHAARIQLLQRRAQPGNKHHLALGFTSEQSRVTRFAGQAGIGRRPGHGPPKLREQPDGGLHDKLVFGVGVGHGVVDYW
jgi:hypothetical protein